MPGGKASSAAAIEGARSRFLRPGGGVSRREASCRLGEARGGQERRRRAAAMAARVRTRAREEEEGRERRKKDKGRERRTSGHPYPRGRQRRRRSSGTSTAKRRIGWSLHRQRAAYRLEEDDDQRKLGQAASGLRQKGKEGRGIGLPALFDLKPFFFQNISSFVFQQMCCTILKHSGV
jgi:hypothetical protein